ncbi:ABC transporter permease [Chordicoccus furentiruminis]|uniref:ABC transporter permease n=1 Tax=Chordicoccus furentiruminis TaxID=2709410 RepID=UPI0023A7DE21|nr:ABC transporter permease [Chordicoccus furentiruminis]
MKKAKSEGFKTFLNGYGVVTIVLIAVFIVMSFLSKNFMTGVNMYNLMRSTAVYGIIALAMTFVIVTGGIDLSVGTHVGMAGMVVALLTVNQVCGIWPAVFIALALCAVIGLINGIMIYDGGLPPFIATLGMMMITRAIILLISNAKNITGLPQSFLAVSKMKVGPIPFMAVVWFIAIAISFFIFKYTVFGRNVFSVGSNIEAARLSGIPVRRTTYGVYVLSGIFCGVGGILLTSRVASGIPTLGTGYEMNAIAAAVVGGASMNGGEGYIGGTVVGSILIATIANAGTLLGLNSNITDIIVGVLIVASVLIDKFRKH